MFEKIRQFDKYMPDHELSSAEVDAGVTPSDFRYPPGDIRRYGAVSDGSTDCSQALASAIAVAQENPAGTHKNAVVYIPAAIQGWKIDTGVTVTVGIPFRIVGDNIYYSYLYTSANITVLTVENVQANAGCLFQDFSIVGGGGGVSTLPGFYLRNSSYTVFKRVEIIAFHTNLLIDGGSSAPHSSYSCVLEDCVIVGAGSINIDCSALTNFLVMRNVTFGGAPSGFRIIDSAGLLIDGGDCESCTSRAIDLDATSDLSMAALIQNVDFESSACSLGVIRIGATALVRGVTILSNFFGNDGGSQWSINPIRSSLLTVIGNVTTTGAASGFHINPSGTLQEKFFLGFNSWQVTVPAKVMQLAAYSASITINASSGDVAEIQIADGAAFTINNPTNAIDGQELTLHIINVSGGAHGAITLDTEFKTTAVMPAIASGANRMFVFRRRLGTAWYECYRSPSDIPN